MTSLESPPPVDVARTMELLVARRDEFLAFLERRLRDAVHAIWPGVKVLKVNTLNRKGKRMRNRRSFTYGRRADTKRAIITLADGSIDLFEGN